MEFEKGKLGGITILCQERLTSEKLKTAEDMSDWLVVVGLTALETISQFISGRLPKRGRKRRKDR